MDAPTPNRREFLDRLALGAVAVSGLSLGAFPDVLAAAEPTSGSLSPFDTTWPKKMTGRVKAVFDCTEVESGFPVWRASVWAAQYAENMAIPAKQITTAIVLRHNAVVCAMSQEFWDKYEIGKNDKVMHPLTNEPLTKNPALLGTADGVPEPFASMALPKFIERGNVALACNLALQFVAKMMAKHDGTTEEVAHAAALKYVLPGVIVQPSGVFAAVLAQSAGGAHYVRAG